MDTNLASGNYSTSRCGLCTAERPLSRSHIIPSFLYQPARDHTGVMNAFYDPATGRTGMERQQQGIWERLLCVECEALLSKRYERPFANFWRNADCILAGCRTGERIILRTDYASFKLFHLSILFRAAISSNPFFQFVRLVEHDRNVLRQMLLAEKPDSDCDYPIRGDVLFNSGRGKVEKKLVSAPCQRSHSYLSGYEFIFGGIVWNYLITGRGIVSEVPDRLMSDGTIALIAKPWEEFVTIQKMKAAIVASDRDKDGPR